MSIVFTDNFTVSADINLDAYPSGSPNYAYNLNSGAVLSVLAASDRVYVAATAAQHANAYLINPAAPLTDYQITAECYSSGPVNDSSAWVSVRNAVGSADFYMSYVNIFAADDVRLWRCDAGVFTLLASVTGGFTADGMHTHRLRVTGTNPVRLELQVDNSPVLIYNDSSASRKTSGRAGIGGIAEATLTNFIDNVSVDDLLATYICSQQVFL